MISPCILCTGPGSDILILKFVYLKADVQDFSIPGSDVDFEALELHFRHFSGLRPNNVEFQSLKLILGISISLVQTCEWGNFETTRIVSANSVFREA